MRHIICLIITSIGLNAQPRPFPIPNRIPLGGRVPAPIRPANFGGPAIKGEHVKLINGDLNADVTTFQGNELKLFGFYSLLKKYISCSLFY